MYAPGTLDAERSCWKPIVYMNLIKSVSVILDCIEREYDLEIDRDESFPSFASSSASLPRDVKGKGRMIYNDQDDIDTPLEFDTLPPAWAQQIANLRLRLLPLISMEATLGRVIGTGVKVGGKEQVFVRKGWQGLKGRKFKNFTRSDKSDTASLSSTSSSEQDIEMDKREDVVRQATRFISACCDDVAALYYHPAVKSLIKKRKLRLEESSSL